MYYINTHILSFIIYFFLCNQIVNTTYLTIIDNFFIVFDIAQLGSFVKLSVILCKPGES